MSRFYVPAEYIRGNTIHIGGNEAHHIIDVMRLKISDSVTIFDGKGNEYDCVIRSIERKSLTAEIKDKRSILPSRGQSITLIQAIPKKEKMDYIVQKATELGVSRLRPVVTARTIPEWSAAKRDKSVERWKKIAGEAAKQCGRSDIPEVLPVEDFKDAINGTAGDCVKVIAALSERAVSLKSVLKDLRPEGNMAVAIGPEGDFTEEEIVLAEKKGFRLVNLGPRVLKSDTAGLAVLAVINYESSD